MSRRDRHFKLRQASRLDWLIRQEEAAEQLRREQEEAEIRLQRQLDQIDLIATSNNSLEVGA